MDHILEGPLQFSLLPNIIRSIKSRKLRWANTCISSCMPHTKVHIHTKCSEQIYIPLIFVSVFFRAVLIP